jgi:lipoate-protein ligase A
MRSVGGASPARAETRTALPSLRVIHDEVLDGPTNMARDEALLTLVGAGDAPPTLRTYRWSGPTISLGYFQPYAAYAALDPPAGGLPVVRRQTGGGAILHDRELTYSITLPLNHPLIAGNPNVLYELAHDTVIACLRSRGLEAHRGGETDGSGSARGPFFCFARRHRFDVLLGGDKLVGSAQRRTRHAVLQHGSIMFGRRYEQQPHAVVPETVSLSHDSFRRLLAEAFARRAHLVATPGEWRTLELARAAELSAKYAGREWTRRV